VKKLPGGNDFVAFAQLGGAGMGIGRATGANHERRQQKNKRRKP
jgi:hypothetical protein